MSVEDANFISQLNPNWPLGTDFLYEGDDHDRVTKKAVQQSFPNINAAVTTTPAELNLLTGIGTVWTTGDIKMAASVQNQNGWLLCDGAVIPVTPENQALITMVGANTPNLQGQFTRGWSEDATIDPEGPRVPLATQAEAFKAHSHTQKGSNSGVGGAYSKRDATNNTQTMGNTDAAGGAETRPKNVAVAYFIHI